MLELLSRRIFERDMSRFDPRAVAHRDWAVIQAGFPILDILFGHATAAPLRVRLTAQNWDQQPPQVDLLDAAGSPLRQAPPGVGSIFHPGPHPDTGRPFVCMRGTQEFHTHPSHLTEYWDNYRGQPGLDLPGLAHQIWRSWKRAVG